MYLGRSQLPALQISGQITINMPPSCPYYLQHNIRQLPDRTMDREYKCDGNMGDGKGISHGFSSPLQPSDSREHCQNRSQWEKQHKVDVLEARLHQLEDMLQKNIQKVNKQTLGALRKHTDLMSNQLNSHEQLLVEQNKEMAKWEKKWMKISEEYSERQEKQMKDDEHKVEQHGKKIEQMERRLEELLEAQRIKAEEIRQQQMNKITLKLESKVDDFAKHFSEMENKVKESGALIQKVEKKGESELEKVEARVHLRVKEEGNIVGNQVEDLKVKTGELQEKIQKLVLKVYPQLAVDRTNPFINMFRVEGNQITRHETHSWEQVLLDALIRRTLFVFTVHITNTKGGFIAMGVTDRLRQRKQRSSYASGNAVSYYGYGDYACIYYGAGGAYQYRKIDSQLRAGTEVRVEVNLEKGNVTFIHTRNRQRQQYVQDSDILIHSDREFVPFIEMYDRDSVRWTIQ